MPTLNWIGKEAVVNHDKEVPFRLLKKIKANSVGENSQNLIIKGDNLEGLKALMPYYHGKIKCIYIDPPYNTGNESWVYNDKVNSPKIKKWLGKVVGGEAEDLCRHDKWLCMMYPRLKLLRDLLSETGVIFVSIDDNELYHLGLLLDEIFGKENQLTTFIWQKTKNPNLSKNLGIEHEYIVAYSKDLNNLRINNLKLSEAEISNYSGKDEFFSTRGPFKIVGLNKTGTRRDKRPNLEYDIIAPDGNVIKPKPRWRWSLDTFNEAKKQNRIIFNKSKQGWSVYYKQYLNEDTKGNIIDRGVLPHTILSDEGTTTEGTQIINSLLGRESFDFPKPTDLIKYFLKISTNQNDIILDSFAGSGTTGHAVLDLNKEDGGNRKFILIEMEDDIAKKITAERIKRAIEKYDYKDGFEYCELDKPLFDEKGQIEETCDFNQFATYIYFTETQTNIDKKQIDKNFIGEKGETEYYLIYKEKMKNVLDKGFLSKIKKTKNKKVIYADFCMVDDDTLKQFNIQFKQIPYEVKVY